MPEEYEYNGKAMGTDYSIVIVSKNKELANYMYKIALKDIEEYEIIFSRFLSTSELSTLNQKKDMKVSKIFLNVTLKAYYYYLKTNGIFNPLISVFRFGYDRNYSEIKNSTMISNDFDYDIDFSTVVIDEKNSHIHLNNGQNLDYGGFLKGYLAEIIAKKIKLYSKYITGVIVNIGGDINTRGLDKHGNQFIFFIYNPILKNSDTSVTLYNQSLATSGTYKRNWLFFNKKIHHILDSSGKKNPDNDIVSATVVCNDGAQSEAFTKVFLSIKPNKAIELLDEKNKNIKYILINNKGQIIKNINENIL